MKLRPVTYIGSHKSSTVLAPLYVRLVRHGSAHKGRENHHIHGALLFPVLGRCAIAYTIRYIRF